MAQFIDRQAIVRINRVRAIDNFEGILNPTEADFFPEVTVDGRSFSKPDISNDNDISPSDWVFSNQVSERLVPITIRIREADPGDDTTADINPASGRKELNLTYDMVTGQVRDADTNELYASSEGQIISLQGAGDDDRAAIEFSIVDSTSPNLPENALLMSRNDITNSGFGDIRFRGNSLAAGDFNNDGKDELVVGALNQTTFVGASQGGAINVYGGTDTGVNTSRLNLSQSNLQSGRAEASEHFGASLVTGDFDGDGFDDVVVGVPFEKVNGVDAGAIHAIYGSSSGLNPNDDQLINQGTDNFASNPLAKEAYGNVLAVADFNKDGKDDLVVGVPFDKRGNNSVGGVNVIYGSNAGLSETVKRDQFYNQSVPGMPGLDDNLQGFGEALAVGDFNSDGNMDLAIGVPNDRDGSPRAGVVDVIFGTRDGLPSDRDVTGQVAVLSQALGSVPNPRSGDEFGKALAVGDFNGDGEDDIAVGAPGRSSKAGVVYIYEGQQGQKKFSSSPKMLFQQSELGSQFEAGDRFGAQLAAADLNGDNIDDLVISAPGEDNETGVAHLLFGSRNSGITTNGNRLLRQGDGVGGTADERDRFGTSLAIGNFDGKGRSEIAVSVPGEAVGQFTDSGTKFGGVNIVNADTLGTAGVNGMSVVKSTRSTTNLQGGDVDGILRGNQRNNRLSTGGGGDIALGMGGNDVLNGQIGDDLLDGGKGRDQYIGGKGYDTFVISHRNGKAVIRDFEDKIDSIGLAHGLEYEDLTLKKRGQHTEIRFNDQSLAIVRGTRPAQLKANDFVEVEYNRLQGMLVPSVVV